MALHPIINWNLACADYRQLPDLGFHHRLVLTIVRRQWKMCSMCEPDVCHLNHNTWAFYSEHPSIHFDSWVQIELELMLEHCLCCCLSAMLGQKYATYNFASVCAGKKLAVSWSVLHAFPCSQTIVFFSYWRYPLYVSRSRSIFPALRSFHHEQKWYAHYLTYYGVSVLQEGWESSWLWSFCFGSGLSG